MNKKVFVNRGIKIFLPASYTGDRNIKHSVGDCVFHNIGTDEYGFIHGDQRFEINKSDFDYYERNNTTKYKNEGGHDSGTDYYYLTEESLPTEVKTVKEYLAWAVKLAPRYVKIELGDVLKIHDILNGTITEDLVIFDNAGDSKFTIWVGENATTLIKKWKESRDWRYVYAYNVDGNDEIVQLLSFMH